MGGFARQLGPAAENPVYQNQKTHLRLGPIAGQAENYLRQRVDPPARLERLPIRGRQKRYHYRFDLKHSP